LKQHVVALPGRIGTAGDIESAHIGGTGIGLMLMTAAYKT